VSGRLTLQATLCFTQVLVQKVNFIYVVLAAGQDPGRTENVGARI